MSTELRNQLQLTLGDAYALERELGGGGMSRVFVAMDKTLERWVVIKVLPPELSSAISVERFRREIVLAARLQHPHVVSLLAAGETGGLPYYAMPFVEGDSLRARLTRGEMPVAETISILRDVARALEYAHRQGVVHRDIKPDNVLLAGTSAVVTDFGVARALSESATAGSLTSVGVALGTPAYMAPEQAAADPTTDFRADIYAWGVVAYEMLAGHSPFAGRTTQAMLAAHLTEQPASIAALRPTTPPPLADLVMRCLEKRPGDRPQSAGELLRTLDNLPLSGASSPDRSATTLRGRDWTRHVGWVAPVLLVIIVAGGWLLFRSRQPLALGGPIVIAVLPFEHHGRATDEYLADALSNAVSTKLATISGFSVIDQQSTREYKGTRKPLRQIGHELGARYLLAGSMQWNGDTGVTRRAQVVARLIDANDATTKWAGPPTIVTPTDPFTTQAEIASQVVTELRGMLASADRHLLEKRPTANREAYDLYVQAQAIGDELSRSGRASVETQDRVIGMLDHAVALDSGFVEAWARLGLRLLGRSTIVADTASSARALRATNRALALDSSNALAHRTLGWYLLVIKSDLNGAARELRRAVQLAPSDVGTAMSLSGYYKVSGQLDSAFSIASRAVTLNPRSVPLLVEVSSAASLSDHTAAALDYATRAVSLDSSNQAAWKNLIEMDQDVDSLRMRRDLAAALRRLREPGTEILQKMAYAGGEFTDRFAKLGMSDMHLGTLLDTVDNYIDPKIDLYTRLGRPVQVLAYQDSMRRALEGKLWPPPVKQQFHLHLAAAYLALGQPSKAREQLSRAEEIASTRSSGEDLTLHAAIIARLGDTTAAIAYLERAVSRYGHNAREMAAGSPKLLFLRGNARFERFIAGH